MANLIEVAPLEDPTYIPLYPPINGGVPEVVAKWGPRSQLRWFDRFARQLSNQREEFWAQFYCSSLLHRGSCCCSCLEDYYEGYDSPYEGRCCCRAIKPEDM